MKILILCTGNSCRSQMAHGFLQSFDDKLYVRSAGTHPAEHINPMAVSVMKEAGIDISDHIPVDVENYIDEPWDYVITVCSNADATCPSFKGRLGKRLHIGFDDPSKLSGTESYVTGEFRRVRDEIKNAFVRFYLSEIKKVELPHCTCE